MANDEQRRAFGRALSDALDARDLSQRRLAPQIHSSQQKISTWVTGAHEPTPDEVFHLEDLLELEPGSLSRHLGYVPAETDERDTPDVVAAIMADPRLEGGYRESMLAAYQAATRPDDRR